MTANKHPSSYRLSPECRDLIERLAATLGISQAGVIDQAVRKLARAELAELPPATVEDSPPPEPPPKKGKGRKPKGG
jgi:hypothetical protein